jgi:Cu-processing system permease protein
MPPKDNKMLKLASLTIKGVFRDKVFRGILMTAVIFFLVPAISTLSMRQVTALSLTLSLSLISFILLLLSIFLGGTSLWKDMERRYTFSVLSLPISRTSYILGKFLGIAGFVLLTTIFLGTICCLVVWYVSGAYPPDRPIAWFNVVCAIFFDALKYILLISCAFLFSTVSTSFFLPIFGAISLFFVGSATQGVYDYIHSSVGTSYSPLFIKTVTLLYYILPNFSAFDLKVNAVYGVKLSVSGLAITCTYFAVYTAVVLTLSAIIFSKREIK